MGDYTEGKKSLTPFANKRIIEMIRAGVDISTISELTEEPANTIAKLDDVSREQRQKEEALLIFLKEDKNNFKIKRKGYIDCPYCGNSYDEYIKQTRGRKCQICQYSFIMDNGNEYCEAHHIQYLSENGSQSPENVILLCPNHHRMFHYAHDAVLVGNLVDGK